MGMTEKGEGEQGRLAVWRVTAEAFSCGRSMAEQVEMIRRYGNHGASPVLRAGVLAAHGIARPRAEAEICVLFGCYRPFTTPFLVRDCIRLLEMLEIDYTYLDQEYCCGAPLAMLASDEQSDEIGAVSREFNQLNLNLAREKGATTLVYCCVGCMHAARNAFRDTSEDHVYILDVILDRLEQCELKAPLGAVGYFEGCHSFFGSTYPGTAIDWGRYRQRLAGIDGLEVVAVPGKMCCKQSAEHIVEWAEKMSMDKILCPCNWCYSALQQVAKGRVRILNFPELLVQSLEHTVFTNQGD
jgi:hypothetical protein